VAQAANVAANMASTHAVARRETVPTRELPALALAFISLP